jgi:hypothetical protein
VANKVALGVSNTLATDLDGKRGDFNSLLMAVAPAKQAAKQAVTAKDQARRDFEAILRQVANIVQANPSVTPEQLDALGLKPRDDTRTPVPPPTSKPVAEVDTLASKSHTLRLIDSGTGKRSRPVGVIGAELWLKVGNEPPVGPSQMTLVGIEPKTKFNVNFADGDAGKTAYYQFRWLTGTGEKGPWSQQIAATIAA